MINIDLTNKDIATDNTSLFQWDYGQKLSITGLSVTENIQVHFARPGQQAEIRLGDVSDGVLIVSIPDAILQKSGVFKAYIYFSDTESGETIKIINLNVREREKPTDYTTPDHVDVVAELNQKLNQIIETGIANYEPDPALVDALVSERLNAILGNMATKDEVSKTDLNTALAAEIDGKLNSNKIVQNLAVTEYGFVPDAKTVSTQIGGLTTSINNLNAKAIINIKYIGTIADVSQLSTYTYSCKGLLSWSGETDDWFNNGFLYAFEIEDYGFGVPHNCIVQTFTMIYSPVLTKKFYRVYYTAGEWSDFKLLS